MRTAGRPASAQSRDWLSFRLRRPPSPIRVRADGCSGEPGIDHGDRMGLLHCVYTVLCSIRRSGRHCGSVQPQSGSSQQPVPVQHPLSIQLSLGRGWVLRPAAGVLSAFSRAARYRSASRAADYRYRRPWSPAGSRCPPKRLLDVLIYGRALRGFGRLIVRVGTLGQSRRKSRRL